MEQIIASDSEYFGGDKWIILLGDLIDRGPQSASVIDYVLSSPPNGIQRICIAGNHEVMMCGFLNGRYSDRWLEAGGIETLESYGIDRRQVSGRIGRSQMDEMLKSHIPDEHVHFLMNLPKLVRLPGCAFVHIPSFRVSDGEPAFDRRMMLAAMGLDYPPSVDELFVIHGHDIVTTPAVLGNRVNVDTGAYLTGRLSAVRLRGLSDMRLFQVSVKQLGRADFKAAPRGQV